MSRGYPDFFSVPIFPTKGAFKTESDSLVVATATVPILLTLAAKGNLVSGAINATGIVAGDDPGLIFTIDGVVASAVTRAASLRYSRGMGSGFLADIFLDDLSLSEWAVKLNPEFDWGQSISVQAINNTGHDLTFGWAFQWYEVVK